MKKKSREKMNEKTSQYITHKVNATTCSKKEISSK